MIKNIIFDFGDIFINLDKAATLRELNQLGMSEPDPELMHLFLAYEKGSFSTASFLERVKPFFPNVEDRQLISAWNAILLDFPDYRLEFLEALARSNSYRMFLLSNTNELHMTYVKESLGNSHFSRFANCFESVCLSHEMQMRKPEPEIFRYMLERFELQPNETFFVDDNLENTQSAAGLGIRVWHLNPGIEDIVDLSKKLSDA
ncbi:HAD family hydrolase [Lentiprolixibacter aurantiacus]|uniref:HAD family phosphatase n=1 Tax=Lentiprolixibacter aurantiacus TaxID=2993939 RepID=A0AAE3MKK2_9FLAO|nr:HAD family phosphatase [Lentiprolixibacter aurantiacus]MCX2719366.1 HAD family phosphatase [Lentiprolixibacter aurantiacus]